MAAYIDIAIRAGAEIVTPVAISAVRGTQFRVAFEDPAARNARTEVVEGLVRADNPAQQSGADLPRPGRGLRQLRKGAADALRDVAKQVQRNKEAFKTPPEQMPQVLKDHLQALDVAVFWTWN